MKTIAITGVSGAMGKASLKHVMNSSLNFKVKALLLKKDKLFGLKIKSQYRDRIEVIYGDIRSYDDCLKLVKDSDYVLHLAALIPPKSDYDQKVTFAINYGGTKNIVDAVKSLENRPKLVHISTVAIYGDRNYLHPWGRVGDPLLPSVFDVYATSKMMAERYVLESGLPYFAVLRQTGILHDKLLLNNVSDGLMFHTPWNVPIEWVSAEDSGRLMASLLEKDCSNQVPSFWKKVYNIGGGKGYRQTGYDTFDDGFKLIGGSVESFFEPNWNAERNFHCFWFEDSDVLNDLFHFQNGSTTEYWKDFQKRYPYYSIAKLLPSSLVRKMVIERLLKDKNAPANWLKKEDTPRVNAVFGNKRTPSYSSWNSFPLLKDSKYNGGHYDYEKIKNTPSYNHLDHGYDESKLDSELDIEDMRKAAEFRGGRCLSTTMVKGDLYTPLEWSCHKGHVFKASPYTILKAGHWCNECAPLYSWDYDLTAPYIPFYSQVYYDSHERNERMVYSLDENKAYMVEGGIYEG